MKGWITLTGGITLYLPSSVVLSAPAPSDADTLNSLIYAVATDGEKSADRFLNVSHPTTARRSRKHAQMRLTAQSRARKSVISIINKRKIKKNKKRSAKKGKRQKPRRAILRGKERKQRKTGGKAGILG